MSKVSIISVDDQRRTTAALACLNACMHHTHSFSVVWFTSYFLRVRVWWIRLNFSQTLFMCLKWLASYRKDGCFFSIAGLGSSVRGLIEKVGWEGGALYRQTGTACQQRTNHCSCRADVNRSNGILIDLQLQSWHQTIMQETYFLQYCIVLNNNGRQEV